MNARRNRSTALRITVATACLLCASMPGAARGETTGASKLGAYNVVWDTPSKDASESMPCGGGDIGLNVWVENGDILFYMQRSGSLAENNEYLKLGRVRLRLDPNPFPPAILWPSLRVSGEHRHPASQVIDASPNTKWFVLNEKQAWVELDFGPAGARPDSYVLTSAEDRPGRDPKNWTLSGSNDGKAWTALDQRKDEDFPRRRQTRSFALTAPRAYRYYRFEFENSGDPDFQLAEIGLFSENRDIIKTARQASASKSQFRQELKLHEGYVEIKGQAVGDEGQSCDATVRVWVEVERPIVHVDVESSMPIDIKASYENWRLTDEIIPPGDQRRQHSFFTLYGYPGEVTLTKDTVEHAADGVLFYHRNPGKDTAVDKLIEQQGLEQFKDEIPDDLRHRTFGGFMTGQGFKAAGTSDGKYQITPFRAWDLKTGQPARQHHLRIVTHIAQSDTLGAWRKDLQAMVDGSAADRDAARQRTLDWWDNFWNRGWIAIHPDRADPSDRAWRVGRNYNLFRYQLGCNALGEYPSKFNGGSFTFDANLVRDVPFGPDWRTWGGGSFTAQNQRLLYWPMLKAGDFDAILPQFELYRKALPGSRARVRKNFGHDGAVYSEYVSVPGVALGEAWGWESGPRSRGTEIPFGDPRANGARYHNGLVEKGAMASGAISYHWESQLEHAYMILEYRRFTGADISPYMPFIENAVVFFDEHYRKRQKMRSGRELDDDGRLVIYPSTSCESYRGARNPSDVIAGLQACLEGILALPDADLKLRDKGYYRAVLETLPPFRYATVEGDRILQPAASWQRRQNFECPQFYPLFPFNRFDLLRGENDHLDVFRNTWKHGDFPKDMVISWHQDGIFFARMGMTDEAADFNSRKLDDSPRRFPTFWGLGHDWVPDHNWGGSGMIGLQEMLMQTIGDEIRLLPAWPTSWDVDFRLHAPQQTVITASVRGGKIVDLQVEPEQRRKDVVVVESPVRNANRPL